eukprot:1585610-Rhodomonas_salina.1
MQFSDMQAKLRNAELIRVSRKAFVRALFLSLARKPSERMQESSADFRITDFRVMEFLGGYVMAYYPARAFENEKGVVEKGLSLAAKNLLERFEVVCKEMRGDTLKRIPLSMTDGLAASYFDYVARFKKWRLEALDQEDFVDVKKTNNVQIAHELLLEREMMELEIKVEDRPMFGIKDASIDQQRVRELSMIVESKGF